MHILSNKCAKNGCKWTVLVQLIVEDVTWSHVFWNTVYLALTMYLHRVCACRRFFLPFCRCTVLDTAVVNPCRPQRD